MDWNREVSFNKETFVDLNVMILYNNRSNITIYMLYFSLGAGEGPSYGTPTSTASKQVVPTQRGFVFALIILGPALGPALLSPLLALSLKEISDV